MVLPFLIQWLGSMKAASFALKTQMPTAYLIMPEYASAFFVRFVTPVMFSAMRAGCMQLALWAKESGTA
jgi:hypothetical protein